MAGRTHRMRSKAQIHWGRGDAKAPLVPILICKRSNESGNYEKGRVGGCCPFSEL